MKAILMMGAVCSLWCVAVMADALHDNVEIREFGAADESSPSGRAEAPDSPTKFSSGREWKETKCGLVNISNPTPEGVIHVYTALSGQSDSDRTEFCYEVGDGCGAKVSWSEGKFNRGEDDKVNTVKTLSLKKGQFTYLALRGPDGCHETLKVENRGEVAIAQDKTEEAKKILKGVTRGLAAGLHALSGWPQSIADLRRVLNVGHDSDGNGVADAHFDSNFAAPNSCDPIARKACTWLKGYGVPCVVTWFYINGNPNDRHAIIRVQIKGQWTYMEPQLNQFYGFPRSASDVYWEYAI